MILQSLFPYRLFEFKKCNRIREDSLARIIFASCKSFHFITHIRC